MRGVFDTSKAFLLKAIAAQLQPIYPLLSLAAAQVKENNLKAARDTTQRALSLNLGEPQALMMQDRINSVQQ
jgi:hypothetical protein